MWTQKPKLTHQPFLAALTVLLLLSGAVSTGARISRAITPAGDTKRIPLNDLGTGTYLGFTGGLYPAGTNVEPPTQAAVGLLRAMQIQPLDIGGNPSPNGKYILLSVGMSNTTQEFCSVGGNTPCNPWTFMGQATADQAVNTKNLVIINGASGSQTTSTWASPNQANYDRVQKILMQRGLSEKQVQIVWLKEADAQPRTSLPAAQADAYLLESGLVQVLRTLKIRYPNLQQVFLSSRIYAGYATTGLNPEPYAYESGFSVKWVIQAQIVQMDHDGKVIDQRAGDLDYNTVASWIAWGPYLWADGLNPRSDGLIWERADLQSSDGTHPSQSGQQKVGTMLLNFFKQSPYTRCWFVTNGTCP